MSDSFFSPSLCRGLGYLMLHHAADCAFWGCGMGRWCRGTHHSQYITHLQPDPWNNPGPTSSICTAGPDVLTQRELHYAQTMCFPSLCASTASPGVQGFIPTPGTGSMRRVAAGLTVASACGCNWVAAHRWWWVPAGCTDTKGCFVYRGLSFPLMAF